MPGARRSIDGRPLTYGVHVFDGRRSCSVGHINVAAMDDTLTVQALITRLVDTDRPVRLAARERRSAEDGGLAIRGLVQQFRKEGERGDQTVRGEAGRALLEALTNEDDLEGLRNTPTRL